MTILDDIINEATRDDVPLAALLRKVKVVAARIGAQELRESVDGEIAGYEDEEKLPKYRARREVQVLGHWSAPFGREMKVPISSLGLEDGFVDAFFTLAFRQPVAELVQWMQADRDPGLPWPPHAVQQYNRWVSEGKASGWAMFTLAEAHTLASRQALAGLMEAIRSSVLDFAVNLQATDPNAGSVGGPTIAAAPVAEIARATHIHIYGTVGNLAVGDHAHQELTVEAGDGQGLLAALTGAGASDELLAEVRSALDADESARPSRIRAVAAKLGSGTLAVAANAAGSLTAEGAIALLTMYLGGA